MSLWKSKLMHDPITPLIRSSIETVQYFTKRDLLDESVAPISTIWQLPEALKIIRKQEPDGSWTKPGKLETIYPRHHYSLVETWKTLRLLVEEYGFTRLHPATARAAEFIFSCQSKEGDIRGFIGNQYATYYTGAIIALLIKAGYEDDPRIERGFKWLLSMRQYDGGWTIPILTHKFDRKTMFKLTSQYAESVEPDRSKPFSHNWTDMVLRAFAAHSQYRKSKEAKVAADLLKGSFFQPDYYASYRSASYWVRFLFWWPNLVTALDSLSLMEYSAEDPNVKKAIGWLVHNQERSGLWKATYAKGKKLLRNENSMKTELWITHRICRILRRFLS
jgi:hypothetical protein